VVTPLPVDCDRHTVLMMTDGAPAPEVEIWRIPRMRGRNATETATVESRQTAQL